MTTTPNALSDAVKTDYDELVTPLTARQQFERWRAVLLVATLVLVGIVIGGVVSTILFTFAGPTGGIVAAIVTGVEPLLLVPAFAVCLYALKQTKRYRAQERETMFTLYGISVDASTTPHIYSIGVPESWVKPALVNTRKALRDAPVPAAPDDVKAEPAAAVEPSTKPGKKSPKDD
ncbi:hypothetical protein [Microbacterium sp. 77mftsu3.1]|uniref:hypothetical protein n=1 Tax=Microbacterium sp. 77mftsu3.1 TaxID=1761802 RepID=UPI000363208A|nr:hypothetical protein [Microbacterium sp. 77mftsu3.1]SDH48239.1 hypothetical protein SAMN04488590_3405 [Microbacterium sp. 77mftsu3.1]